jgi:hypothetical protein
VEKDLTVICPSLSLSIFFHLRRLPGRIRPNMHVVANFLSYEGGAQRRLSSPANDLLPLDDEDRIATGGCYSSSILSLWIPPSAHYLLGTGVKGAKGDGRLIHVLNKDESGIRGTSYFQEVSSRSNVILLGDHLGDLRMAEGLSHEVCLTVGFLNDKAATDPVHLDIYTKSFDVVILAPFSSPLPFSESERIKSEDEASIIFVNQLLKEIREGK